jgi:hypothetical protein
MTEIKTREPLTLHVRAGRREQRGFITVVKDTIHFHRSRIQPSVTFGTDFESQSARERGRHERIIYPHWRSRSTSLRNSLVARNVRVSQLCKPVG